MTTATEAPPPTVVEQPLRPVERERLGFGRRLTIVLVILLNIALIAAIGWLVTNRDRVADQFAVWNYTPSAAIIGYADRSAMSGEGRFLFYASKPVIATGTTFDSICASHQEGVGILGCYVPNDRSIHLFDVTDVRLAGLEEVVASHEMLHAAWDRMSVADRAALAPLLEAEVAKRSGDKTLADSLAFYATAEPGERLNELHSILGTKYADLSPQLEAHYSQYFTDRQTVVKLNEASNAVFLAQKAQITDLVARIDALAAKVATDFASYNAGYDVLSADIASFNARASGGKFATQKEFETERSALLARQAALDRFYSAIEADRGSYNVLVGELKALNAAADKLNQAINIAPRAAPGL